MSTLKAKLCCFIKQNFFRNFFLCGISGWCLECFWTGLGSILFQKDKLMQCRTSIWMFPIYGIAACLSPICSKLKSRNILTRGVIYMILIYLVELFSGLLLKKHKACPWDYSKAKHNYKGVIRLDYAPAWFLAGLLFERLLKRTCADDMKML